MKYCRYISSNNKEVSIYKSTKSTNYNSIISIRYIINLYNICIYQLNYLYGINVHFVRVIKSNLKCSLCFFNNSTTFILNNIFFEDVIHFRRHKYYALLQTMIFICDKKMFQINYIESKYQARV